MFRVRGVHKLFPSRPEPVHALRGVDLHISEGQLTAVLGPSGCGKTTLLRTLAGFERPDAGEIHLDGKLVAGKGRFIRPEHRRVGVVAQEGALFPHLTVAENVSYGLPRRWMDAVRSDKRAKDRHRVDEMLELVGLPGYGNRLPDELSGGQQQRVALARALAPGPKVVLLDEPFSALDAALRVEVREEVRDLLRAINATAVLVTHDQSEALSLADYVAIMRDGQVVQSGTPAEVYLKPVDPEAAAFLGDSVEMPCRVRTSQTDTIDPPDRVEVECALGIAHVRRTSLFCSDCSDPSLHMTGSVNGGAQVDHDGMTLVLRPEQFVLADSGASALVCATSYFGHDGLVRLRLQDGTPVLVRLDGEEFPEIGSEVRVRLAPSLEPSLEPVW